MKKAITMVVLVGVLGLGLIGCSDSSTSQDNSQPEKNATPESIDEQKEMTKTVNLQFTSDTYDPNASTPMMLSYYHDTKQYVYLFDPNTPCTIELPLTENQANSSTPIDSKDLSFLTYTNNDGPVGDIATSGFRSALTQYISKLNSGSEEPFIYHVTDSSLRDAQGPTTEEAMHHVNKEVMDTVMDLWRQFNDIGLENTVVDFSQASSYDEIDTLVSDLKANIRAFISVQYTENARNQDVRRLYQWINEG